MWPADKNVRRPNELIEPLILLPVAHSIHASQRSFPRDNARRFQRRHTQTHGNQYKICTDHPSGTPCCKPYTCFSLGAISQGPCHYTYDTFFVSFSLLISFIILYNNLCCRDLNFNLFLRIFQIFIKKINCFGHCLCKIRSRNIMPSI